VQRAPLSREGGIWLLAGVFVLLFFSAATPSPLYGVYEAQWRFSATTLTAVFAVYALALLVALLVFGSVSDYLGLRPVIVASLVMAAGACVHNWNLARSTGQDLTIDPGLVAMVDEFCRSIPLDEFRGHGAFGPEVESTESASPTDRLMALLGRRP
jgi:uncharacterized protein (TIGR03086 family)